MPETYAPITPLRPLPASLTLGHPPRHGEGFQTPPGKGIRWRTSASGSPPRAREGWGRAALWPPSPRRGGAGGGVRPLRYLGQYSILMVTPLTGSLVRRSAAFGRRLHYVGSCMWLV